MLFRSAEFGVQPHCNAHSLVSYAKQNKFTIEWLGDIRSKRKPADQTFRQLLGSKSAKERLLISLDIDSVQISDAPGCSAPQTLGFSPEEVLKMSFLAGSISRVDSFGIFELSPPLDPDGRTALLAAHCIRNCMEGYATRFKVKKLEAKPRSRG